MGVGETEVLMGEKKEPSNSYWYYVFQCQENNKIFIKTFKLRKSVSLNNCCKQST